MSRDYGYPPPPRGGGDRWDAERFEHEERSHRFSEPRFDDRSPASDFGRDRGAGGRGGGGGGFGPLPSRMREHSDEDFHRRGPPRFDDRPGGGRFEEDRYEKKVYYDDEPRYQREEPFGRERGGSTNITIEKEREYYRRSPSPPRRAPMGRPAFLRRQSSLDTFDRKPLSRFQGRDEYGPPAKYREEPRLPPLTPIPLPKTRQLGAPPRRYEERDYEEIRVAEPDFYGDDEYRAYPERVREREIVRTRRKSKERRRSRSRETVESRTTRSVRSSSSSSRETSISVATTTRNEFPKKGKTRMPARLVSKQAIKDLGYPFEEEGDVIIIQKALGRENIDEVIKLSEDYKNQEKPPITETTLTTYVVGTEPTPIYNPPPPQSEHGGTIYEETKTKEVFTVPPPPQSVYHEDHFHHPPPPPPPPQSYEVVTDTKVVTRSQSPPYHHHHHDHHNGPVIIDAGHPHSSSPIPVGPLMIASRPRSHSRDERSIRDEIRALEAEKEALRAERRAERELRKADRIRHSSRHSEGDLVLYEEEHRGYDRRDEVMVVKKEYVEDRIEGGGVKILKDKKGPPPKLVRAMLKTLT